MLSIIFWIFVAIVVGGFLFFIGKIIFFFMAAKKLFNLARTEASDLPEDVARLRKEVKNENASEGTETFLKKVFVRWYKKLVK